MGLLGAADTKQIPPDPVKRGGDALFYSSVRIGVVLSDECFQACPQEGARVSESTGSCRLPNSFIQVLQNPYSPSSHKALHS
jgi:hypothetical protein